jgi:hypothetical protein
MGAEAGSGWLSGTGTLVRDIKDETKVSDASHLLEAPDISLPAILHDMDDNRGPSGNPGDSTAEYATGREHTELDRGQPMKLQDEITTITDVAAKQQDGKTANSDPIPETVEGTSVHASEPAATRDTNTATESPYCHKHQRAFLFHNPSPGPRNMCANITR